jgi:choline dehydrogenase-like flavoprotein
MTRQVLDAEILIIGSGPAGVSAAFPLVEAGRRVLMIDGDGAAASSSDAPEMAPAWQRALGRGLEALQGEDGLSPKLRTPAARAIVGAFHQATDIATDNFAAVGARARGGLSRIWGGYVGEFDDDDLVGWPFRLAELQPSYRAVTARIGVSGSADDDMAAFHGLSGPVMPAPPIGPAATSIIERYRRGAPEPGFSLGLARNALLTSDRPDRHACDLSLSCLWGCARGAIYDARQDLLALRRHANFTLIDDAYAVRLARDGDAWRTVMQDGRSFLTSRVALAAGALGSLRLVAPLLPAESSKLPLLSSPVMAMPLLLPSLLGMPAPERGYALAQLGYAMRLSAAAGDYVTGGVYEVAALPASSFVARLPLGRRAGTAVFGALAPALTVATSYFPGRFSANCASWTGVDGDARISIRGGFADGFAPSAAATQKRLRGIWRRLGAFALPGGSVAMPGTDVHFGGLFPMGLDAANGSSRHGELNAAPGLFVVDGSVLPSVPSKFITLTIMANADRIGRYMSEQTPQ